MFYCNKSTFTSKAPCPFIHLQFHPGSNLSLHSRRAHFLALFTPAHLCTWCCSAQKAVSHPPFLLHPSGLTIPRKPSHFLHNVRSLSPHAHSTKEFYFPSTQLDFLIHKAFVGCALYTLHTRYSFLPYYLQFSGLCEHKQEAQQLVLTLVSVKESMAWILCLLSPRMGDALTKQYKVWSLPTDCWMTLYMQLGYANAPHSFVQGFNMQN